MVDVLRAGNPAVFEVQFQSLDGHEGMSHEETETMRRLMAAHAAAKSGDIARLRSLSLDERGKLIAVACAAAGLPRSEPAPWPASTWEFQKRHAARFRE